MTDGRQDTSDIRVRAETGDPLDGDVRVADYFGEAWSTVEGFALLLRRHGVERGLLGPNESWRLWERHLLNSAGGAALLPTTGTFIDLGSGAGLPGVVVAAMRPRAHVVLLEPMERRTTWLRFVVDELGLGSVEVVRGRAEDVAGTVVGDAVTARAVSALDRLLRWAAPLVRVGGGLYAIKGERAAAEVVAAKRSASELGWKGLGVEEVPTVPGVEVTRVVRAVRTERRSRVRQG